MGWEGNSLRVINESAKICPKKSICNRNIFQKSPKNFPLPDYIYKYVQLFNTSLYLQLNIYKI